MVLSIRWRTPILVIAVFALSPLTWAASEAPKKAERKDRETRYESLEVFQKVLHFVETNYVENVDNQKLIHGAIKGMLENLDPHSNFLPPDIYRDMKIDTTGKYGGVGLEMGVKDNVLTVVSPIEDTPAWRAGVKSGDRVVRINGESTKGMTLSEAISKMKGKKGTPLRISIYRKGLLSPKEVTLQRDTIRLDAVKWVEIEPGFGYVRLTNFNENAARDIARALGKLEAKSKLRGLVLDLRGNPGGLLDQAVDVSSLFVDDGVIVSTKGRGAEQEIRYAKKGQARKEFPVAVLVNESSASAAEIVAGALQDHHRAIILGQPTFGKGSVQTVIDLSQDMGLKLTIARYYTPSGRSIQEKGVVPDVFLEDYDPKLLAEARRRKPEGLREKDLRNHIENDDEVAEAKRSGKPSDFSAEELRQIAQETPKKTQDTDADEDWGPEPFKPKEDYQVMEAMNHLKSYAVFKRLATQEWGGGKQEKKIATGERGE